jgi:hypothetical protein
VKEREHLRGNAVDSAVDDADEGDREATRNLRNGKHHFFFLESGYLDTDDMLAAASVGRRAGIVLWCCVTCVSGRQACGLVGDPSLCPRKLAKRSTANTAVAQSSRRTSRVGGPASSWLHELVGSAREAAEERSQLGGDTENGAFDDADDGGDETHENTSLFCGRRVVGSSVRGRYSNLQKQTQASK